MSVYAASVVGMRNSELLGMEVDHKVYVVLASSDEHAKEEAIKAANNDVVLEGYAHYNVKVVILSKT